VFPQLAGLGQSSTAVYYGLAGVAEAEAYLRDPVLGERLVEAGATVRSHLGGGAARVASLVELMGSQIDALKLVSCMTLFRHVATRLHTEDPRPRFLAMAEHAGAILEAAAAQGHGPCAFTEAALRRARRTG